MSGFSRLMLALCLATTSIRAQEPGPAEFAVVDLTAIFEAHPRTTAATAELTKARDEARKKFRAESAELKSAIEAALAA